MDSLQKVHDSIGVKIDADSPFTHIALSTLLLVGVYTIIKPFLSYIRALLSLFILPGASVRCYP